MFERRHAEGRRRTSRDSSTTLTGDRHGAPALQLHRLEKVGDGRRRGLFISGHGKNTFARHTAMVAAALRRSGGRARAVANEREAQSRRQRSSARRVIDEVLLLPCPLCLRRDGSDLPDRSRRRGDVAVVAEIGRIVADREAVPPLRGHVDTRAAQRASRGERVHGDRCVTCSTTLAARRDLRGGGVRELCASLAPTGKLAGGLRSELGRGAECLAVRLVVLSCSTRIVGKWVGGTGVLLGFDRSDLGSRSRSRLRRRGYPGRGWLMGVSPRGDIRRGDRVGPARRRQIIGESTGAKYQEQEEANLLRPASLGCLCCLRPRGGLSFVEETCSAFTGETVEAFVLSTDAA